MLVGDYDLRVIPDWATEVEAEKIAHPSKDQGMIVIPLKSVGDKSRAPTLVPNHQDITPNRPHQRSSGRRGVVDRCGRGSWR